MKYFILAGEPSGDLHGARLMRAVLSIQPEASFFGHGGNDMINQGLKVIQHVDSLSIMGFTEVIKHLPRMLKIMGETIQSIEIEKPNRIILIDYPGFNLRLAKNISHLNIPITYFILPQVWAWKEKRVKTIKRFIDQALCIFPFEQEWFERRGVNAHYVGHPFADRKPITQSRESYLSAFNLSPKHPVLILLPGSRQQEVNKHWPTFIEIIKIIKNRLPSCQYLVAKAPGIHLNNCPDYIHIEENSRLAITNGTAAIAASGTATLECAVEDIPLVVCYKFSPLSWMIIKNVVKVHYASMVNLILNKELVPEFLQSNMNPSTIVPALIKLLDVQSSERKTMLDGFNELRRSLGLPGVYERAADAIIRRTKPS